MDDVSKSVQLVRGEIRCQMPNFNVFILVLLPRRQWKFYLRSTLTLEFCVPPPPGFSAMVVRERVG
jgi:hypothetical protein